MLNVVRQAGSLRRGTGRILLVVLLLLTGSTSPAGAQIPRTGATGESPFALRSWRQEGVLLGAGAVLQVAGLALERGMDPLSETQIAALDASDIPRFDRWPVERWYRPAGKASDVVVGLLGLAPLSLLLDDAVRADWLTLGVLYLEIQTWTNAATSLSKGATRRARPFNYNSDVPLSEKTQKEARRAFWSRHTATAFAAAVFTGDIYAAYYPGERVVPLVRYGLLAAAAGVGWLRVRAGVHFPSDVVAGAAAGGLIAWGVLRGHRRGVARAADTTDRSGPRLRLEPFGALPGANVITLRLVF